jgi:hypothetical protein
MRAAALHPSLTNARSDYRQGHDAANAASPHASASGRFGVGQQPRIGFWRGLAKVVDDRGNPLFVLRLPMPKPVQGTLLADE